MLLFAVPSTNCNSALLHSDSRNKAHSMNSDLNLNRVESLTEESFKVITQIIRDIGNELNVVEFGSGSSSIRLAMELKDAHIISIESSPDFLLRTNTLAQEYNVQSNLKIKYAPLQFQTYGQGRILSYQENGSIEFNDIDCVIIDGPPFYTLRGREACLYQIYAKLKVGGVVILDDVQRDAEKQILSNWLHVYPDCFSVEIKKTGHWLAILQKRRSVEAEWNNQVKLDDGLVVDRSYESIKLALLQITDAGFANWLTRRGQPSHEYLKLLHQIRDAYGIASDDIATPVKPTGEIMREKYWREERTYIELCLRLFGMADSPHQNALESP
jgi:predicted O-methyltransferase YrrM